MRILLIEDTEDIAEAVSTKLTRDGHDVTHVIDGDRGREQAVLGSHDLIVLDINLPGTDGFAILQALRGNGSSVPVLVITARDQINDKVNLFDLGADDHIVKPFDLSELAARVRALLRRHLGAAASLLQIGPLTVDIARRAASLRGEPLELGRREFEMLQALAARQGKPLNKERMMTALFGFDDVGSLNAVELLVSRLRRKLDGSGIEIVTQRGVGYFLRERSAAAQ
ncbi:response regulator transcription factor [Nitratireductor aquimarinus]|nr:response regulator transcription factor [Nitratireductor pacificus]MBN7782822.1 response regulator transcription factor [Nitratireductor pacificus]MBN7791629.1 response regulator transcription factor [Nitratireductor aquimarinus]MBY6100887.1 response regulator transcription factor [Nitratireductor aquimarinus]